MANQFLRQDFILNEDGSFPLQDTVVNGIWLDTPYGNSDEQHIADIIFYQKGWLQTDLLLGFGISQYDNAEISIQDISDDLNTELKKDGYITKSKVIQIIGKDGFTIDSSYIENNY